MGVGLPGAGAAASRSAQEPLGVKLPRRHPQSIWDICILSTGQNLEVMRAHPHWPGCPPGKTVLSGPGQSSREVPESWLPESVVSRIGSPCKHSRGGYIDRWWTFSEHFHLWDPRSRSARLAIVKHRNSAMPSIEGFAG